MTYTVSISYGSYAVDLTNNNVEISHRFTNPFVPFSLPQSVGQTLGQNTKVINIGLIVDQFDFTFTLKDGPGTYNFGTPLTKYETLIYLAAFIPSPKVLTLGSNTFYCQIESINVSWAPGKKNVAENCMVTVQLCDNISMS